MRKSFSFLALLLSLTISCGGGGGSSGGGSSAITINGSWSGLYNSSNYSHFGNMTATFTQSGSSFTGTLAMGYPCSSSGGTLSGSISGYNISFSTPNGNFSGTFTASSISGTYNVTSGACSGDSDIFTFNIHNN